MNTVGEDDDGEDGSDPSAGVWVALRCLCLAALLQACSPATSHALVSMPHSAAIEPIDTAGLNLGGPGQSTKEDIATLKRLLRDLFMEQMVMKRRLLQLDPPEDTRPPLLDAGAAAGLRRHFRLLDFTATGTSPVTCTHTLEVCSGLTSTNTVSAATAPVDGNRALQQHVYTGPRLLSHAAARLSSALAASVSAIVCRDTVQLWQAQVQSVIGKRLFVTLSPVGARFKDTATPLHASQGALATVLFCKHLYIIHLYIKVSLRCKSFCCNSFRLRSFRCTSFRSKSFRVQDLSLQFLSRQVL